MILADKIIELRKKAGMSQDELAEQMDVSRQSVSKWEGAQSVPDLNKILKMSDIFGVSTDYLLKDDFEKPAPQVSESVTDSQPLHRVSMEDANKFLKVNRCSAFKTASGVALCILSIVPVTIFSELSATLSDTLGTAVFLLMIAGAVGLFISAGAGKKPFSYLETEDIDTAYGVDGMLKEKQDKFFLIHTRDLIIGVMMCVLSILPINIIEPITNYRRFSDTVGTCIMLCMIAGGVFLIVRASSTKKGFSKLLEKDNFTREKKSMKRQNTGSVTKSYWLIVIAGYLAYSFITSDWGMSWIVFPVAGILTPVVYQTEKHIRAKAR